MLAINRPNCGHVAMIGEKTRSYLVRECFG